MTYHVILKRNKSTDDGTIGTLTLPDGKRYSTNELPWRDNKVKMSCIPGGTYQCAIVKSPRFGRVYGVADVPGRSHILIHAGNYAGDVTKGKKSDVEGCILIGTQAGILKGQQVVVQSRVAMVDFMNRLDGKPFTLEIIDAD